MLDKAIGKETIAATLDFPQLPEAQTEVFEDTKKIEFEVIKYPSLCLFMPKNVLFL